jgi:hypothetical protein
MDPTHHSQTLGAAPLYGKIEVFKIFYVVFDCFHIQKVTNMDGHPAHIYVLFVNYG